MAVRAINGTTRSVQVARECLNTATCKADILSGWAACSFRAGLRELHVRYDYRKKEADVSSRQTLAVRGYRERLKQGGWVRCEVKVRRDDVELIRTVATALRDPDRDVGTRALLRERLGAPRPRGFKELLAACPVEGLDLGRPRDFAARPVPVIDGLLAATARVHDMTLVTRNASDVDDLGAAVLNPFEV